MRDAHGLVCSFAWAVRGVVRSVGTERNLRIHLVAACYAVWAGFGAKLDGASWAAVLLCCGAVIAAELFNTALEFLCDALCPEQNEKIGAAKDAAAGAVLVLALISVAVAVAIFGPWILSGGPWVRRKIVPFLLSLPLALWLIVAGGQKMNTKEK